MASEEIQITMFVPPVSFEEMVRRLFNRSVPGNKWTPLMHSAIGVIGEVLELKHCIDNKNLIEECGDVEFYLEAALQSITDLGFSLSRSLEPMGYDLQHAFSEMERGANELLDISKKGWVYNKEIDLQHVEIFATGTRRALSDLYKVLGIDREDVLYRNMEKLIGPKGRFRDGFYTDQAAQDRADKVE